ncbi:DNA-binding protein [Sinorhizobium medicae]|nr:DNA-binding protein [Sinorhizobium medicae]
MADDEKLNLVWGVGEIARIIGRSERVTFHLVTTGAIPAKKVGGRWVAERSKLIAFFMESAA